MDYMGTLKIILDRLTFYIDLILPQLKNDDRKYFNRSSGARFLPTLILKSDKDFSLFVLSGSVYVTAHSQFRVVSGKKLLKI